LSKANRKKNILERGLDFIKREVDRLTKRGAAPPEIPPEPNALLPVEPTVEDTDDDWQEELEEYENEEEDREEEADEEEEDDFQDYLDEINEQKEEEDRTIEVQTVREFIDAGGDVKQLRKVRYVTQQEAQDALESRGIDAFAQVLFDEETESFAIVVGDSPGAKARK
jgi:hypothetical protein